jgi:hypothetical protein
MIKLYYLAVVSLVAVTSTPVLAQDADSDAAFDDALRNFGYAGGVAVQCTEGEEQAQILRAVTGSFDRLTQLFGTQQAFTFAAAFGAGTTDSIDSGTCEDYIAGFAEGISASMSGEN